MSSSFNHTVTKLHVYSTQELITQYKVLMSASGKYTRTKKRAIKEVIRKRKEAEKLLRSGY
jgi:hypothetical protein